MKSTIGLLFIICFVIIGKLKVENNAIRSDLKNYKDQDSTIHYLKTQIYLKDSIMQNIDVFIQNEKIERRVKQQYFKRNLNYNFKP